jgi:hypothetical protein
MGAQTAWPLYLSIGNIDSKARNSAEHDAWLLIAYLPTVVWADDKRTHTTLNFRLIHQCLKHVLHPLIAAGNDGVKMMDSVGSIRKMYPIVAAWFADYPEQCMLAIAAKNQSPITIAGHHDLDSDVPLPPRTREWILEKVAAACSTVNPSNVIKYTKAAKREGILGVHEPFWEHLPWFQPEYVMCPDILHGLLKFWHDHILKWTTHLVGKDELNGRLRLVPPVTGFKSFSKGIQGMTHWTGREDRELQRIILPVIANASKITEGVMTCLRAFHDFLFLVQYRIHTPSTLKYLSDALADFHKTKQVFIDTGARRGKKGVITHFRIPKVAAFHFYQKHIVMMGTSPQFSTEITESAHKKMAKEPYRASNHRDYIEQMCRFLDRRERIAFMRSFLTWGRVEIPKHLLIQQTAHLSTGYQRHALEALAMKQREAKEEDLKKKRRIKPRQGIVLNKNPRQKFQTFVSLGDAYLLPDLVPALHRYLKAGTVVSPLYILEYWDLMRMHVASGWSSNSISTRSCDDSSTRQTTDTLKDAPRSS